MRVAVVGAGISGCATYHALRKHFGDTVDVQLYDAYPAPHLNGKTSILGAGLGLAPNGIRALYSISSTAAEAVELSGFTHSHMAFRNSEGKTLGYFPVGSAQRYGFSQRFISREDVHRALMLNVPEGVVHWNRRVRAVEEHRDGVRVLFEDGSDATADLVIGADGVKSVVAKGIIEEEYRATYAGSVGVGGFLPIEALPESIQGDVAADGIVMTFGPDGFFGLARSDSTRTNLMWWSSFRSQNPINNEICTSEIHRQLSERHGDWKAPYAIPSIFRVVIDIACDPGAKHPVLVLPRYTQATLPLHWASSSGRIVLIGDAAHALSSQGASCAIEDAVAYTRLWAYFVKTGLDTTLTVQRAARAYEDVRRPRVSQVLAAEQKQWNKRRGKAAEYIHGWLMWVLCQGLGNRINDKKFGYDVNEEVQRYLDRLEGKPVAKNRYQTTTTWRTVAIVTALAVVAAVVAKHQF